MEEDLDSGDEFSDGADDGPDTFDELHDRRGEGAGGSLLQASSEARGHSSSTQLAVVKPAIGRPSEVFSPFFIAKAYSGFRRGEG